MIPGLENLHPLTDLILLGCFALETTRVGSLEALTSLCIDRIDVETVRGLDILHSLSDLALVRCKTLQRLPFLGHLKALARLNLSYSGVDEIPGVRELVNLKKLYGTGLKLEWLPDLGDLPRLKTVFLRDTPLARVPFSIYFEISIVNFNEGVKWSEEVGDVSDADYVSSDQEYYDEKCESSDLSDTDG